ncbi:hypothetical protein RJ640_028166 [Escallonia rubra]|uniref:Uncharacterized protein n=1 Tax=Escallonia rubra TaxID=112253 RepID=A0AA88U1R5_9ASTE|nr:hypothetical protein RJ640_028166 [Escallonia rubra]
MNSLCGSLGSLRNEVGSLSLNSEVGSLKSANSCSKQQSNSQADESVTDSKKAEPSSDLEHNSLTPSSLSFPALKFEVLDVDVVEVQSPDSALWESFFTDHLDGDFMISSPVRNVPSPQASNFNYNYNYVHSMHGHSLFGCSPPRSSSPLGPYSSTHKGKGLSPLQKVFNSPNNQYMQVESLSLPALENFLDDDYERDDDFLTYSTIKTSGGSNSAECYDTLTTVPALLDCLTQPNSSSSRFCGSVSETSGSQLTQESDVYQMGGSVSTAPLLQQLQKERQQEQQQAQQQQLRQPPPPPQRPQLQQPPQPQNMSSTLMVPIPVGPEQILYQACPYIKFAHFTANQAIFEAFEAEERVHVIDLDILQGYQWPAFMQALAARPGGPPFLRITGVGCSPEAVRETGRCLTELAHSLHVPFEFHPVGELLEDLKPHMFNRRVGEALAVNSVNRLQRVPGNALSNLLAMIRDQAPNIVTIVEQEASHNGPYFLGRFLEALHYYSAIFDSLDATFPLDSAQRAKVEQYIFAPEIRNIVAYEGVDRVMRHERLEKWRKIMEGKGFKGVPLSANAVTQSKILLGLYTCDGYRLTEDKGCLLLGWQDRAIIAASAWRC